MHQKSIQIDSHSKSKNEPKQNMLTCNVFQPIKLSNGDCIKGERTASKMSRLTHRYHCDVALEGNISYNYFVI